jgi:hypothetical protein
MLWLGVKKYGKTTCSALQFNVWTPGSPYTALTYAAVDFSDRSKQDHQDLWSVSSRPAIGGATHTEDEWDVRRQWRAARAVRANSRCVAKL